MLNEYVRSNLLFILRSSLLIMFSSFIAKFLGYFWIYLISKQGPEVLGYVSLALSFGSIFQVISSLGILKSSIRNYIYYKENFDKRRFERIVNLSFTLVLISNLVFLFIVILFGNIISTYIYKLPSLYLWMVVIAVTLVIVRTLRTYSSHLWADNKVSILIISSALFPSVMKLVSLLVFFYLLNKDMIFSAIVSFVVSEIMSTLFVFMYALRISNIKPRIVYDLYKYKEDVLYILRYSLPLVVPMSLGVISKEIDKIMLNYFLDVDIVGVYAVSIPFITLITTIITSLYPSTVVFTIREVSKKRIREFEQIMSIMLKYIFIFSLLVYAIYILYGMDIIRIIFGKQYVMAYYALVILYPAFMIPTVFGIYGRFLWSKENLSYLIWVSVIVLALSIVLNYVLIPRYGIIGASISTLIISLIGPFYTFRRTLKYFKFNIPYLSLLISFLLALFVLYGINYIVHIFIEYLNVWQASIMLVLSILVYIAVLFIFRIITIGEIMKIIRFLLYSKSK